MGIAERPAGDEYLSEIGNIVAIGVLEIDCGLSILHNDTTAIANQRGWYAQTLCKNGKLVSMSIVVGVLTDLDAITALTLCLKFIRVIDRFTDIKPATFVPVHRNWFTL